MINIVIAEDHNCLIDGIDVFFKFEEDISIVGRVNDGIALLDILKKKHVNVAIVDIRMPKLNGIEATKQIAIDYPHIKVIAFSMYGKKDIVNKMIKAGAKGYLLKNAGLQTLLNAVREVYVGKTYYDPNLSLKETSTADIKQEKLLTDRQYEILELIGQGLTNKEISEKLFIGVYTVGTHRKNIIQKLNLKGRDALLTYALNRKNNFD